MWPFKQKCECSEIVNFLTEEHADVWETLSKLTDRVIKLEKQLKTGNKKREKTE